MRGDWGAGDVCSGTSNWPPTGSVRREACGTCLCCFFCKDILSQLILSNLLIPIPPKMPVDPSRWMRQRHSHPRIGPAYQATIPALEGGPYPQVPLKWLGEAAVAEAEAQATTAGEPTAAVPGKASGRSRGGAVGHKQQNAASQTSRPMTRKMRATAARNAEQNDELHQQRQPATAGAVTFSASLLADAAREMKELSAGFAGEKFFAAPPGSTAVGSDTAAGEPTAADLSAAGLPAEVATTFYGGLLPSSADNPIDAGVMAGEASTDVEAGEATAADPAGSILSSEIPRGLIPEATAAAAESAAAPAVDSASAPAATGSTEAPPTRATPAPTQGHAAQEAREAAEGPPAKHQLGVTDGNSPKRVKPSAATEV